MLNQIPFILLLIIFAINLWYVFAIIYHLIRFGIGAKPKIMALFFFISSIVFFLIVFAMFNLVDWQDILDKLVDFVNLLKVNF
ncbi:hypothetical protein KKH63_00460 [Patescibacteria group bacterium]|nr:hypothetical protein [Patescibacteria group bacterium]